jgi:hypothetical protein
MYQTNYCMGVHEARCRPESARNRMFDVDSALTPSRPQTARERGPPNAASARRLYVSKPLSAVPVVHLPPGVAPNVVEKYWPDLRENIAPNAQRRRSSCNAKSSTDSAGHSEEMRPAAEIRPITPVRWPILEGLTPLALAECRASARNCSSGPQSARGEGRKGKYQALYPAHPHQLRPSTAQAQGAMDARRPAAPAQAQPQGSTPRPQSGRDTAFVSQKAERVERAQSARRPAPDHGALLQIAARLPLACDGRLTLDPQLKQVRKSTV